MTEPRTKHIGLIFHSFESENLGVGAFTVANSAMIGEAIERHGGSPVFHVIGARGDLDYRSACGWPNDFTNVGTKSLALPGSDLHKMLKQCDAFFDIGAGDGFSDLFRTSRLVRSVASKVFAARTGKPLVLSPQTIGPFVTRFGEFAAKFALRGSQKVFARDDMSLDALHRLGMQEKSVLTTDLAFALPYDSPTKKTNEELAGRDLNVGLNVSGFLFGLAGEDTGRVKLNLDYPAFTRRLVERLLAEERVSSVHLVPHVRAPRYPADDDGAASAQLKREYPELIVAPDFASPSDAKSYIAKLDLFMGARMHSTIAAISSNTAVLPLGYSRKFNGLYGTLGYPYLVDMCRDDEAFAMEQLDRVLADLPGVTAAATSSNALAQEKLVVYREYVDRFAEELMSS